MVPGTDTLFGKAGKELLPLLNEGATGIAALQARAKELGLTLTDDDVVAADALDDSLGELWAQVKAVSLQVGAAIAGPLTDFVAKASEILTWVIAFIKENPNLIRAIAAVALGIAAVQLSVKVWDDTGSSLDEGSALSTARTKKRGEGQLLDGLRVPTIQLASSWHQVGQNHIRCG